MVLPGANLNVKLEAVENSLNKLGDKVKEFKEEGKNRIRYAENVAQSIQQGRPSATTLNGQIDETWAKHLVDLTFRQAVLNPSNPTLIKTWDKRIQSLVEVLCLPTYQFLDEQYTTVGGAIRTYPNTHILDELVHPYDDQKILLGRPYNVEWFTED
jgi:hypothetical protein